MEKYYIFHSFLYLGILTIEGEEGKITERGFRKRGLDSKRKGWRGGEGQSAVGFPRILRFYMVENLFLDGNKRGGERCPAGLISLSRVFGELPRLVAALESPSAWFRPATKRISPTPFRLLVSRP